MMAGAKDPFDLPDHKPPFGVFPPAKNQDRRNVRTPMITNAISMEELRERVRQLTVRDRELGQAAMSLLQERGPQAITLVLSLIALERRSSALGSKLTGTPAQRGSTVERQVTGQLRQLPATSGKGGRGGFSVNDTANMQRLFGLKKLRPGLSGPGFFFPGEPP